MVVNGAGVDGGGKGQDFSVYRGDGDECCQLRLLGYEQPPQDQLEISVCGLIGQVHGILVDKQLDAEDGSVNKFGDGAATCIHEGGGEEQRDGDAVLVAMHGGVQRSGGAIDAGGAGDGGKYRPHGYLMS